MILICPDAPVHDNAPRQNKFRATIHP